MPPFGEHRCKLINATEVSPFYVLCAPFTKKSWNFVGRKKLKLPKSESGVFCLACFIFTFYCLWICSLLETREAGIDFSHYGFHNPLRNVNFIRLWKFKTLYSPSIWCISHSFCYPPRFNIFWQHRMPTVLIKELLPGTVICKWQSHRF